MKHIFHVHSYVNYITALGVIEELEINKQDVVLSISRNIPLLNDDYSFFKIEDKLYYHPFNNLKQLFKLKWLNNREVIRAIDAKIYKATDDDDFVYYCPHSRGYLYQVFITNPKCKEVNYIEDGMDAFFSQEVHEKKFPYQIKFYQRIMRNTVFRLPVFARSRLGMHNNAFRAYFEKTPKLFALSKDSFKDIPYVSTTLVDLKKISNIKMPTFPIDSKIFLFDAVVEQGVVSDELLKDFIEWFCAYFSGIKTMYTKFHPFQSQEHREWIISVFESKGINILTVDDSVPIEFLFAKSENLDIYGIGSSLLLYGTKFSTHKVTVLYPFFKLVKNHTSFRDKYWNGAFMSETEIRLLGRDLKLL